jgi:hypothetical protein
MLIHLVIHWPQLAQVDLWPYAILYAVWIWNNMPNAGADLSPIEIYGLPPESRTASQREESSQKGKKGKARNLSRFYS